MYISFFGTVSLYLFYTLRFCSSFRNFVSEPVLITLPTLRLRIIRRETSGLSKSFLGIFGSRIFLCCILSLSTSNHCIPLLNLN